MIIRVWILILSILILYPSHILAADFKTDMTQAITDFEPEIECNVTYDEAYNTIFEILAENSEFFYFDRECSILESSGSKIYKLGLNYLYTPAEAKQMQLVIDRQVNAIASSVSNIEDNCEKIKAVYDYFADNYKYDKSITYKDCDVYTLVTEKRGLCCSFSLLYKDVLDRLDIPCRIVTNSNNSHQWNEVFINNKWRSVDISRGIQLDGNKNINNGRYRTFLI